MPTVTLANPGVFFTIQGEGHLQGQPMTFVRLAGCSVGCVECDTDYRVASRASVSDVVKRVLEVTPFEVRDRWVWVTGGEPTDQPHLGDLVRELRAEGLSVAMASSGVRRVSVPVDWLSISPHSGLLSQRYGNEIKLVPGLNGLDAGEWIERHDTSIDFWLRFLQPLDGDEGSLEECKRLHDRFPHWGIALQNHKALGMP